MRFARVWAMRVPKSYPGKLLRSVGRKGTDVLEATGAARIGALQDFVSQDEADHSLRERETAGQMPENGSDTATHQAVLAGVSDFLVFRLMYVCPASVTVRRGNT